MRLHLPRISLTAVAAASGAGMAAALLSMLTAQKTSLALAMGFVSPLPIMIASLGFGTSAGLISVLVGSLAVGLFDMRPGGISVSDLDRLAPAGLDIAVFALGLGLPALLLSRIAVLPYDAAAALRAAKVGRPVRPEEWVLGLIVAAAAGFAALSVAIDLAVVISKQGGFESFMSQTAEKAEKAVTAILTARDRPLPKGVDLRDLAKAIAWAQRPIMAGAGVVLLVSNLWLAARIAQTSNLLTSPWPDIPRYMRVPRLLALLLAVALGLSFAKGLVGMMSLIVSGALIMAFAMQGLAVVHSLTAGKSARLPLLVILYLSLMLLMPWLLILCGFLGLLDTAFAFRDRHEATRKPKP